MANIKDIPGFNGRYSVTDDGTVISNNYQRTGKKKALKPYKDSHGYYRVQFRKGEKGRGKDYPVHRLVAEAFYGSGILLREAQAQAQAQAQAKTKVKELVMLSDRERNMLDELQKEWDLKHGKK